MLQETEQRVRVAWHAGTVSRDGKIAPAVLPEVVVSEDQILWIARTGARGGKLLKPGAGPGPRRFMQAHRGPVAGPPPRTGILSGAHTPRGIASWVWRRGACLWTAWTRMDIMVSEVADFENGPGFLVLSDQYFPGWRAYVNGKETPVYCVDGLLRGVVVPQGKNVVEFRYRPWKVYAAGIVGLVALGLALAGAFVPGFRLKLETKGPLRP